MAKYDVKFNCGHTETIELYGPGKQRESKIAYYEKNGECSECYKARRQKERENMQINNQDNLSRFLEFLGVEKLPDLTGSEKQIAWAESIRTKILNDFIQKFTAENMENIKNHPTERVEEARNQCAKDFLDSSAKYWIENR